MFFSLGIQTQIYVILFLVAVLPVFTGFKPFTYYISRGKYPEAVVASDKFIKVNNGMSLIWGALFLLAAVISHVMEGNVWGYVLPVSIFALLGGFVNRKMPEYLSSRIKSKPIQFTNVKDMMTALPFGIKSWKLEGKSFSISYRFTGDEPADYLLSVKDCLCTVEEIKEDADLVITCESGLWLDIAMGRASSAEAFLDGKIQAEGDISLIAEMEEMLEKEEKTAKLYSPDYAFKHSPEQYTSKITVIDGSPRGDAHSKTRFMAQAFVRGAESAGAQTEYITLRNREITPCCGCYTCWTKTPGVCVYKDDVPDILESIKNADMVVFASPLYYFSVTGTMKNFMDRMLPLVEPFMEKDGKGHVTHPKAYDRKQFFVVVSASGFPEIRGNFDGLLSLFRSLDRHSEGYGLMGELLLPSAEVFFQPIYARKKAEIEHLCEKMGSDAVSLGKIAVYDMSLLAKPIMNKDKFLEQANAFWKMQRGGKD